MKGTTLWVVLAAAAVLAAARRKRAPRRIHRTERILAELEAKYLRNRDVSVRGPLAPVCPEHGLAIEDGVLVRKNWDRWMAFSTRQIKRAIAEGATTPEHVVARLFYAAFPDEMWPPEEDSPLADQYAEFVATAAENLDDSLRPIRRAKGSLRIVD
jgi:hypothetical protein